MSPCFDSSLLIFPSFFTESLTLLDSEEFDYPSLDESRTYGGQEAFTLGEVAHHGIDWANFDKTQRMSNEVL